MTLIIYHNGNRLGKRRYFGYSKREAFARIRQHFGLKGKRNVDITILD